MVLSTTVKPLLDRVHIIYKITNKTKRVSKTRIGFLIVCNVYCYELRLNLESNENYIVLAKLTSKKLGSTRRKQSTLVLNFRLSKNKE